MINRIIKEKVPCAFGKSGGHFLTLGFDSNVLKHISVGCNESNKDIEGMRLLNPKLPCCLDAKNRVIKDAILDLRYMYRENFPGGTIIVDVLNNQLQKARSKTTLSTVLNTHESFILDKFIEALLYSKHDTVSQEVLKNPTENSGLTIRQERKTFLLLETIGERLLATRVNGEWRVARNHFSTPPLLFKDPYDRCTVCGIIKFEKQVRDHQHTNSHKKRVIELFKMALEATSTIGFRRVNAGGLESLLPKRGRKSNKYTGVIYEKSETKDYLT
jgi:hypothetical protein